MRYKRKLIALSVLMLTLGCIQYAFPGNAGMSTGYSNYVFRPYQSLRNMLFGAIPFSMGDILYVVGGLVLITVLIRWGWFLIRFRSHKHDLGRSLLNTVITLAVIYLLFFLGWGGNYYRPSLTLYWELHPPVVADSHALATYDRFLIDRLNQLAPGYKGLGFQQVEGKAKQFYRTLTDSRTSLHGLNAKPSVFGYFMQYLGIQGYYNPFTGEAQVNRFLPSFMLPFVLCHEMAHQSGIAAEDDANLLSYALCTSAPDGDFTYSGYFNLWLYTHMRLKETDSLQAKALMATLNPVSKSQLDTLRDIRRRYRSDLDDYSTAIYDGYLRMHNQKDGIESYSRVTMSAWAWEQEKKGRVGVIRIP